jgi:hypothetical protein
VRPIVTITDTQKDQLQRALHSFEQKLIEHDGNMDSAMVDFFMESALEEAFAESPKVLHIRIFLDEITKRLPHSRMVADSVEELKLLANSFANF